MARNWEREVPGAGRGYERIAGGGCLHKYEETRENVITWFLKKSENIVSKKVKLAYYGRICCSR